MASLSQKHIQLALALPPRLRTFFARYPPATIVPAGVPPEAVKTAYQEETPNPFLPLKHPATGKWHDPKYSLRRQAELVKLAREHGVEELLPFTHKGTEERLRKRVELGLRVKGTGVGEHVKGHKHERQLVAKYVVVGFVVAYLLELYMGKLTGVFRVRQDGNEEKGHARDARSYQGMEEGWKAELDQVPQVNDQKLWRGWSLPKAARCIDCTIINVQKLQDTSFRLLLNVAMCICRFRVSRQSTPLLFLYH
ncbi:hypothetical protein B0T17DRAFT_537272 [Bombardia bombarda]|uniref:Large ribosomal subunit protein mL59 domain-containing protein n=1 Tax=Bombardia bombarda TaxID=252184 RepID=A0AA40BYJ1_9PEZI|nr:hypothetical protein B0T17DRAFT_537272 [Bombardia bombarda]